MFHHMKCTASALDEQWRRSRQQRDIDFHEFEFFLVIFRMEMVTVRRLTKIVFFRKWYSLQSDQYHGLINDLLEITVESLNDDEDVNVSLHLFNTYKLTFTHRTHRHTHTWLKCQNGMCGCVFHTRRKILFSLYFFFFFSHFVNPEEVPSDCTVAQFQHTQYYIEKEVHHTKRRRKKREKRIHQSIWAHENKNTFAKSIQNFGRKSKKENKIMCDWDTVVLRKRPPKTSAMKTESAVNQVRTISLHKFHIIKKWIKDNNNHNEVSHFGEIRSEHLCGGSCRMSIVR